MAWPPNLNRRCLTVDNDRVFVSYDNDHEFRTAPRAYFQRHHDSVFASSLQGLKDLPEKGAQLRITLWHGGIPVKIEVLVGRKWKVLFERKNLPECLSPEHKVIDA